MSSDTSDSSPFHAYARGRAPSPDSPGEPFHELRVRIPTHVHRQLLALKILRGVTLAETVVLALDRYFDGWPTAAAERAAAPASLASHVDASAKER